VHINSAAKISNVQEEGSNDLALTLKYFQGETCYSMLAGVNKPRVVLKDSMELNYSESLDGAAEGWYFDDETMFLYVKTKFDSESVKLRLLEAL
jgi:hypothetical protein